MKRTITAILAADVAGYSRLISEDEDDTLRRFAEYSKLFFEEVGQHGGRVFNTAGDAILAEFPSAVEALRAGIAIQQRLRALNADYPPGRRVQFRMGLTIGDVVQTESGDLLGDGVNVAARLEGIAEPGGICISRSVHEAIAARIAVSFRDIGPQKLKNIARPIHAFRVVLAPDLSADEAAQGRSTRRTALRAVAALLLVAILSGAAAFWIFRSGPADDGSTETSQAASAPAAPERTDLLSASVSRPQQLCFQDQVRLTGVLTPRREVDVGPDAEGLRIKRVLVAPMDEVAAGEPLAELVRPERPDTVASTVRAPVHGFVGRSTAQAGALTSFRALPLFQIVARGELELEAETPIADLGRLTGGQQASVTPLGLSEIPGRLRTIGTSVDGGTQLGRARIALRTNAKLNPGTFASAVVKVGERCGIGVPVSAIARGPEGAVVYVSNDGRVEGRLVTTGLTSGNLVEIRSGLEPNDTVVTRAGAFVREGDTVKPITVAAEGAGR